MQNNVGNSVKASCNLNAVHYTFMKLFKSYTKTNSKYANIDLMMMAMRKCSTKKSKDVKNFKIPVMHTLID